MSTEPINYEAVIADLEAKKAQLDATITMLRALGGLGTIGAPTPTGGGGSSVTNGNFAADAFMGKSIPEAAITILQSTSPRRRDFASNALRVVEQAIGEKMDGSPLPDPNEGKNASGGCSG